MHANMRRGALGVDIHQVNWALLSAISSWANNLWLISHLGPVVQIVNSWAHTIMPVVATILSAAILLWAGLHPTQLLFHAA